MNLKKHISIFLALFILLVNSSASLVLHFCNDQIAYVSLVYQNNKLILAKHKLTNAKRIIETVNDKSLLSTTFINSDGQLITVVMNQSEKEIVYSLENQTTKNTITIPAHAIQTIVY